MVCPCSPNPPHSLGDAADDLSDSLGLFGLKVFIDGVHTGLKRSFLHLERVALLRLLILAQHIAQLPKQLSKLNHQFIQLADGIIVAIPEM